MDASAATTIRSRLQSSLGLCDMAEDWLSACLQHVQRRRTATTTTTTTTTTKVDQVLYQVLHADLRDVVRGGGEEVAGASSGHGGGESRSSNRNGRTIALPTPIQQLHRGVEESQQQLSSSSSTGHDTNNNQQQNVLMLPEEFRLLCQVEEVVDMAKNSERRLMGGAMAVGGPSLDVAQPSSYGRPQSTGRCLKMFLTHGYDMENDDNVDGTATDGDNRNRNRNQRRNVIIGMETTRINGLSSAHATLAGTKILLQGPIELRTGILMLHGGNCIVLGGCVPVLVERQQQELKAAKDKAGVGVDPTIRALIGTSESSVVDEDGEEPMDEAHEGSADYVPPAASQTTSTTRTQPSILGGQTRGTTTTTTAGLSNGTDRSAWASTSTNTTTTTASTTTATNNILRLYGARAVAPTASTTATTATRQPAAESSHLQRTPPNASRRSNGHVNNPYATGLSTSTSSSSSSPSLAGSSMSPTRSSNPYAQQQRQPQKQQHEQHQNQQHLSQPVAANANATPNNPYQQGATARSSLPSSSFSAQVRSSSSAAVPMDTENQPPAVRAASSALTSSAPSSADDKEASAASTSIQKMTFDNLYSLLLQLLSDREMYESYQTQEDLGFQICLVYHRENSIGGLDFNVEKDKRDKKKDKKKKKDGKTYHYRVVATFANGETSSISDRTDKLLACKIDPILVASQFPVSPAELRAMSRNNKAECDRVTREGSDNVRTAFFSRRFWTARLLQTADEVFDSDCSAQNPVDRLQDIRMPLLLLQGRQSRS